MKTVPVPVVPVLVETHNLKPLAQSFFEIYESSSIKSCKTNWNSKTFCTNVSCCQVLNFNCEKEVKPKAYRYIYGIFLVNLIFLFVIHIYC